VVFDERIRPKIDVGISPVRIIDIKIQVFNQRSNLICLTKLEGCGF